MGRLPWLEATIALLVVSWAGKLAVFGWSNDLLSGRPWATYHESQPVSQPDTPAPEPAPAVRGLEFKGANRLAHTRPAPAVASPPHASVAWKLMVPPLREGDRQEAQSCEPREDAPLSQWSVAGNYASERSCQYQRYAMVDTEDAAYFRAVDEFLRALEGKEAPGDLSARSLAAQSHCERVWALLAARCVGE
jgi:hypothetical protein